MMAQVTEQLWYCLKLASAIPGEKVSIALKSANLQDLIVYAC